MKKILENKYKLLIIGAILVLIISLIYYLKPDNDTNETNELSLLEKTTIKTTNKTKNYIDIKGSVKKPGVYEFKENDRVIDAIKLAGGLTKNANTNNINLSQKLTSEMVIYVYSDSEIKSQNNPLTCDTICKTEVIEVNNCIENTQETKTNNSELININKATISELDSLDGIGESKAQAIIDYREQNGNFKSIDDLKNVSGIGDTLFESIKDKITV